MKFLAASAVALASSFAAMTSSQAIPLAPLGQTVSDDGAIIRYRRLRTGHAPRSLRRLPSAL